MLLIIIHCIMMQSMRRGLEWQDLISLEMQSMQNRIQRLMRKKMYHSMNLYHGF